MGKRDHQNQFNRAQIGRAQSYMRLNLGKPLDLLKIAREAGSSSYHFLRLFLAYTGETPFEFLRRIRLLAALRLLQEDPSRAVTEIALGAGYETPSAFNKAFKKALALSPTEFRNLGKARQKEVEYRLSQPKIPKEINMKLEMKYEIVTRPETHYVFLQKSGPFSEVAPPAWDEMFPLVFGQIDPKKITEYLGLSGVDKTKPGEESMIYKAGVALDSARPKPPKGLNYRRIPKGKYASFRLTGPYTQIWPAFNRIFKTLAEKKLALRPEFCIENYRNDPKSTPEAQLLTDLLVPVR